MATVKLLKTHREEIRDKVLAHRFEPEKKKLLAMEHAVAVMVYEDAFSKKDRELMYSLKKGWMREIYYFNVRFSMRSAKPHNQLHLPEPKRVPETISGGSTLGVYDDDHKIAIAHEQWMTAKNQYESDRSIAKNKTWSVLNSVTTLNRLLEVWPEIADFTKGIQASYAGSAIVPVKMINDLNRNLGLPPEKAA